jgi:hypothetical protein
MNPVPYLKHMEAYQNFGGGLNTVASIDNLRNHELRDMANVDLAERGSLKRRTGMVNVFRPETEGKGQGYFRYYLPDGSFFPITVVNGEFFARDKKMVISDYTGEIQKDRPMEAVQYKETLYIATGSVLLQYDGNVMKPVVPYKPEPLEAFYIGTNALSPEPEKFIDDGVSAEPRIEGFYADKRYGVVNETNYFTIYVSKPDSLVLEYTMSYRRHGSENWRDHGLGWTTNKRIGFSYSEEADYEIRLKARIKGGDPEDIFEYGIPLYSIKRLDENKVENTVTLHQCNRILLHWNRLILFGDENNSNMIYISDLDRPDYFPRNNTLRFETEQREPLTSIVKYRDLLVAFTATNIQALFGRSPEDYQRVNLSSSLGCIAPKSVRVMGNVVTFLSQEGIHTLNSTSYTENRMNVKKIDTNIDNIVPREADACAVVAENQYMITFPSQNIRLRYYYQLGAWSKDESEKLDFHEMSEWHGVVYGQSRETGAVLRHDSLTFDDDGHVYHDKYYFKDYDFGEPYNPKKLKELQLLLGSKEKTRMSVFVYADSVSVINPDRSHAVIDENDEVKWVQESIPNLEMQSGTVLGSWVMGESGFGNPDSAVYKIKVSGKCRRVRVELKHEEATPNRVFGLGFIFKVKKP